MTCVGDRETTNYQERVTHVTAHLNPAEINGSSRDLTVTVLL